MSEMERTLFWGPQVEGHKAFSKGEEVAVGINKTGQNSFPFEIDELRTGLPVFHCAFVSSDGQDLSVFDN